MTKIYTMFKSILSKYLRLKHDVSGVAAVEFALILPVMLAMYLGMVEMTQGVNINRKVTLLSRTLADLAAQASTINNGDSNNIFAASAQVLQPYSDTGLYMEFVSVIVKADGTTVQVCWGDSTTGPISSTPIILPAGLKIPNTSVIIATARLPYTPAAKLVSTSYNLTETTYMRPRLASQVSRDRAGTVTTCAF
jgi:Flp pilus assembly protein TadG